MWGTHSTHHFVLSNHIHLFAIQFSSYLNFNIFVMAWHFIHGIRSHIFAISIFPLFLSEFNSFFSLVIVFFFLLLHFHFVISSSFRIYWILIFPILYLVSSILCLTRYIYAISSNFNGMVFHRKLFINSSLYVDCCFDCFHLFTFVCLRVGALLLFCCAVTRVHMK